MAKGEKFILKKNRMKEPLLPLQSRVMKAGAALWREVRSRFEFFTLVPFVGRLEVDFYPFQAII